MLNPSQTQQSAPSPSPFKVLVVGGSYAGLGAIVNLLDLCHGLPPRFAYEKDPKKDTKKVAPVEITLVDERDGFFHLIGMPMVCVSRSYADKSWVKFSDIPALQTPEVNIIRGSVTSIDPAQKVSTIRRADDNDDGKLEQRGYDYLIAASGIHRDWPSAPTAFTKDAFKAEATALIQRCEDAADGIIVIGGGAVGIEMAAETKTVMPNHKVTLVHSRSKLMSSEPLADLYKDKVLELVHEAGVETVLGSRVKKVDEDKSSGRKTVTLENGKSLTGSVVINAISHFHPRLAYLPKEAVDEEGYIKITPSLNFPSTIPNSHCHYAAGDIVKWSGTKRAGGAMHQGHFSARNIHQDMLQKLHGTKPELSELQVAEPGLCVAVGKKAAAYSETYGLQEGVETLKSYFEDDLGFGICWRHMGLGNKPEH